MNALAELQERARTPANPANAANQKRQMVADSQDSQDSQRVKLESHFLAPALPAPLADSLQPLRVHLLALAAGNGISGAHVHRLHDLDVAACMGLDARQLADYLALLADSADRHAGRVPLDDTAPIYCQHCGPVYVHPTIAACLPMVEGWPRALGCPWCFVRRAGGYIPRPPVACEGCRHFTPDTINPAAGMVPAPAATARTTR